MVRRRQRRPLRYEKSLMELCGKKNEKEIRLRMWRYVSPQPIAEGQKVGSAFRDNFGPKDNII